MMKKQALICGFCVLTLAPAAHAQNGMYYTARSPALKDQSNELRSLTYAKPDATPVDNPKITATGEPITEDQAAETPSDKIWEKYKSLASGQSKEMQKPVAPTPPQVTKPQAPETAAPVGIAGLIQEYQKNKAARSEMRTLVITPPAEAEKIEEEYIKKHAENDKSAPETEALPVANSASKEEQE